MITPVVQLQFELEDDRYQLWIVAQEDGSYSCEWRPVSSDA